MERRGDLAYLDERKKEPGNIGPAEVLAANAYLREVYRGVTGHDFTTSRRREATP
jgi:hypothetical protein